MGFLALLDMFQLIYSAIINTHNFNFIDDYRGCLTTSARQQIKQIKACMATKVTKQAIAAMPFTSIIYAGSDYCVSPDYVHFLAGVD